MNTFPQPSKSTAVLLFQIDVVILALGTLLAGFGTMIQPLTAFGLIDWIVGVVLWLVGAGFTIKESVNKTFPASGWVWFALSLLTWLILFPLLSTILRFIFFALPATRS